MGKIDPDTYDRVGKALVDRLGISPSEALDRLKDIPIEVFVDCDVAISPTLQAALLTIVNLMPRVFKQAAQIIDRSNALAAPLLVPFPATSLRDAVEALGGSVSRQQATGLHVAIGRAEVQGLRVTFDGWFTQVGPANLTPPLAQNDKCVLAGIAGAGVALNEIFLGSLGFEVEAGKRVVGLSLWDPTKCTPESAEHEPVPEYLPGEAWILGLGHLGQGIIWALSMLPFAEPEKMYLVLQDYDRVIASNVATQILTCEHHVGWRKTRVCGEFLRRFGFDSGIIDRPFDVGSRRLACEPALALCGFDEHGPRHLLGDVGFERVIVCGIGGTENDFDDIQIHTMPLQERTAQELWPATQTRTYRDKLAQNNAFYRQYHEQHHCGELELAGVSVAVPFVGVIAGALAWAEVLRELNGGQRAAFIGMPLRCIDERRIRYSPRESPCPRYAKPPLGVRQHTSPR